ncbi:unnamed protein product [Dicrocoelium dendriticum]|nr:unnamed protein product [Dicrocoelium dendriticum]
MDPSEEFVVLDEEAAAARNMAVDRLSVLIDLFSKALDSVNQSNVLLKDELRSALTVTLQHVVPDDSTLIEDLVKKLDGVSLSTEEVRASYVRRLCSRLVVVNEEKQALESENNSLRESLKQKEHEFTTFRTNIAEAALTVRDIEIILSKLENRPSDDSAYVGVMTTDLCASLVNIRDRLSRLSMNSSSVTTATGDQIATTQTSNDVRLSIADEIAFPELTGIRRQELSEITHSSDVQESVYDSQVAPNCAEAGRPENPSFGPSEEDPWCPCCTVRFSSREELETHLQSCLQ